VEVDKEKLDAWGIPTLKIHCDWSENERRYVQGHWYSSREILAAGGAKDIEVQRKITPPGLAIHEMAPRAWDAIQKLPSSTQQSDPRRQESFHDRRSLHGSARA